MIGTLLAQAAPGRDDFWSKLLGIDKMARDGDVRLEWDMMPEAWVLALVILPLVAGLAFFLYRSERKDVGLGPKILLTAFRALLLLVVLFMIFGPKLSVYTIEKERSYVVVLVDDSTSMLKSDPPISNEDRVRLARVTGISDDDILDANELEQLRTITRAEVVKRALQNGQIRLLEELESKLNVQYYTFSNRPTGHGVNVDGREQFFLKFKPEGRETAIGEAMRLAMQKEQNVVAIIVLSDFKNNSGVDPAEVAKQFKHRYLPVYAVLAGIPQKPRDVELLEPEGNMAIVKDDDYVLDFKIKSSGFNGQPAKVGVWIYTRKKEDRATPSDPDAIEALIQNSKKEKDIDTTLKGDKQEEKFVYRPKEPGEYFLIFKIDPREGETTRHNNYLVHPLKVHDDKIKVLYVEHPPRYEYRFLKNALIRDTKILCHVLLTSADPDFPQEHTKGSADPDFKEPLKEFPKTREQLFKYDVLILGDVDPQRLGGEEVWENIRAFVTEFGGGLILISGQSNPRLFLDKPALRSLIPVEIDESRTESPDTVYDRHYGYRLTEEAKGKDGKHHPIILYKQFASEPHRNLEHWEDNDGRRDGQIGIRWFLRTKGVALNAVPLVTVTGTTGEKESPPLFVIQYNGRGRVFWSGTDETWLWRYLVGDYPWFYPFWQQAMYWARQGKLLGAKRYRVDVDKDRYSVGEKVKILVSAWDEKFVKMELDKLDKDTKGKVYVETPEGKRELVVVRKERSGYYTAEYTPQLDGNFKVWAGEEDESTRADDRFVVEFPAREEDQPILDEDMARKKIADESYQASKGRSQYYTIDRIGELAQDVKANDQIMKRPHQPRYLWSSPLVWLIFTLLITLEWVLRKVWRML